MADTNAPRDDWQEARGGRIDHSVFPGSPIDEQERIDESIAESFPASDPPSWNGGLDQSRSGSQTAR